MQRPGKAPMVEPCDICGAVDWPELIITCSKCNIFSEHVYCMRNNLTEIPEYWLCESCRSENGPTEEHKRVSQQVGAVIPPKKAQTLDRHIKKPPKVACGALPTIKSLPILGSGPAKEDKHVSQQRMSVVISDKKIQTYLRRKKTTKGTPCESPSIPRFLPVVSSGTGTGDILGAVAERNRSNIGKSNLESIQKNLHRRHKYLPSSIHSWRGRFQILQTAASCEFYAEFEARSPCIINRNAYKFSTTMPSVLQLESLPALNVLTDVFGNDSPSLQDIALYFFPSDNTERSRKNLNKVFKFMNAEKSMLRSFIDGVELLVFTSNHLNMDTRGTFAAVVNGEHFLWGVFRHNKIDKAIERLPDMEPIDMDIDMIGGKDVVGRVDHAKKVEVLKKKPQSLQPLD